jgi:hypothetical protein
MSEKLKSGGIGDASDLSDLWLDPGLNDGLTDTTVTSAPMDKPKDFFRVHPSKSYRRLCEIYTHKPEAQIEVEHFIVAKPMRGRIEEARPALVVTCMYRDGSLRLWPLKRSRPGEKDNEAWSSARKAANAALSKWVRLVWVRRAYEFREAQPGYAPVPDWENLKLPTFDELVMLALGPNGIIRDVNHPIYRDLMGAAPKPALKVVGADDTDSDESDDL